VHDSGIDRVTKEFLPDKASGNYPVVFRLRGGVPVGAGESRIPVVFRPLTWGVGTEAECVSLD